jgi:hypothetical protein
LGARGILSWVATGVNTMSERSFWLPIMVCGHGIGQARPRGRGGGLDPQPGRGQPSQETLRPYPAPTSPQRAVGSAVAPGYQPSSRARRATSTTIRSSSAGVRRK